jgi:hypothetical protein
MKRFNLLKVIWRSVSPASKDMTKGRCVEQQHTTSTEKHSANSDNTPSVLDGLFQKYETLETPSEIKSNPSSCP